MSQVSKKARLPWFIPEMCVGCAMCQNACGLKLISMTADSNSRGIDIPWIYAPQKCSGCGRCANACSYGALMMTSYVKEASNRLLERKR